MSGLHAGQPVLATGDALERARAAMVLVHGRGASARDILMLAPELEAPGWAFLAPQAANGTWYPYPFMAPVERNEPWLSSALGVIADLLDRLGTAGIPAERTVLLGFSQGACLTLEYAARNGRRYGGLVGLSGGVIGPDGAPRQDAGDLAGTPVFLGCSDHDPHIPAQRVRATAELLRRLGGEVTASLYPDLDHSVNEDELARVRDMMGRLPAVAAPGPETDGG
ncbi:MAG TPA: dienelactone hydrolase family protein [Candidatus Dormibacteraeota bacterium]|nr:dienelactone hydrolase family protein [Candidatus Dormibacteraeota bacterium]